MRILAEIPHPRLKITIFKHNDKLSLKLEKNLLEQIYKFREGSQLHNIEILKSKLSAEFLLNVETQFNEMMKARESISSIDNAFDDFEQII